METLKETVLMIVQIAVITICIWCMANEKCSFYTPDPACVAQPYGYDYNN